MTRHDDPDTTTPIDTAAGGAPVDGAQAEAERRWPKPPEHEAWMHDMDAYDTAHAAFIQGAEWARRQNVPATPARVSTPAELDALPVGTVVLDRHGDVWQKHDDTERTDDDGERLRSGWASTAWVTDRTPAEMFGGLRGARDYTQVGPFTLLHLPGRDLLAEARAEVAELREQRDQATLALAEEAEARGVERARVDLAAQVAQAEATLIAEAEARGVARGRREALTEAAAHATTLSGFREWLRARAGETPGGGA